MKGIKMNKMQVISGTTTVRYYLRTMLFCETFLWSSAAHLILTLNKNCQKMIGLRYYFIQYLLKIK